MPSFILTFYTAKQLSDGRHPILLIATHKRKRLHITLSYKCFPDQWDKQQRKFKKNLEGHTKKNQVLRNILNKAEGI